MDKARTCVYYSSEKGFLVVPYAVLANSVARVVVEPIIKLDVKISAQELGDSLVKTVNIAELSPPVGRKQVEENVLGRVSGIKSIPRFSKVFRSVSVTKREDCYTIKEWIQHPKGGYVEAFDKQEIILALNTTPKELGMAVFSVLGNEVSFDEVEYDSFKMHNNEVLTYRYPSDQFTDVGDGGVDTYQMFVYADGDTDSANIAFLFDSRYENINEVSIAKKWQQLYGKLEEFQLNKVDHGIFNCSAGARAEDKLLYSHFYQKEECFLELSLVLRIKKLPDQVVKSLYDEYNSIARSCSLDSTAIDH